MPSTRTPRSAGPSRTRKASVSPATAPPPVVIPVPVSESGAVNDINVPLVDIRFSGGVENLAVYLISPDDTEVRLYNRRCAGGLLKSGYDDEAPLANSCTPPPTDGLLRKPNQALSAFNGKEDQRRVEAAPRPPAGQFRRWGVPRVQFTVLRQHHQPSSNLPEHPRGRSRRRGPVPHFGVPHGRRSGQRSRRPDVHRRRHAVHAATWELYGVRLETGSRFTQAQAESAGLVYVDDANAPGRDSMRIVLSDNAGNLIATPRVDFEIDAKYVTGVEETSVVAMTLAPQPGRQLESPSLRRPEPGRAAHDPRHSGPRDPFPARDRRPVRGRH